MPPEGRGDTGEGDSTSDFKAILKADRVIFLIRLVSRRRTAQEGSLEIYPFPAEPGSQIFVLQTDRHCLAKRKTGPTPVPPLSDRVLRCLTLPYAVLRCFTLILLCLTRCLTEIYETRVRIAPRNPPIQSEIASTVTRDPALIG
jgi:hypothetical protein